MHCWCFNDSVRGALDSKQVYPRHNPTIIFTARPQELQAPNRCLGEGQD